MSRDARRGRTASRAVQDFAYRRPSVPNAELVSRARVPNGRVTHVNAKVARDVHVVLSSVTRGAPSTQVHTQPSGAAVRGRRTPDPGRDLRDPQPVRPRKTATSSTPVGKGSIDRFGSWRCQANCASGGQGLRPYDPDTAGLGPGPRRSGRPRLPATRRRQADRAAAGKR